MINTEDQEELLKLVADYLEKDIKCIAIGGTAMMFKGYKNTTKDIDLVFQTEEERNIFIKAIKQLGYNEIGLANIYDEKRKEFTNKPKMFTRGDERFDLFVEEVFGFKLNFEQEVVTERIDFLAKKELTIHLLNKEILVLLKSITHREKDFEDIETILSIEKNLDWKLLISEAIKQKHHNEWILIDLEKNMQQLKKKFFIKKKFFNLIYENQS